MTTDLREAASCYGKTLSDLSPKDKPWKKHKQDALALAEIFLASKSQLRHGQRMSECASSLVFNSGHDPETGEYKLTLRGANFCRVRTCPMCQWRRSLLWRARFYKILPDIFELHPTAKYIFLTLTVANCPVDALRETIKKMNIAWHRMMQRKICKDIHILGWVRTVEITREDSKKYSRDNFAHPHFHAILMMPAGYFGSSGGYLSQEKWMKLWKEALRVDYEPRIDIRKVRSKKSGQKIGGVERDGVIETLKYSVKSADLLAEADWTIEMSLQIDGLRAIATGGVFKSMLAKLDKPEVEAEEMVSLGESQQLELAEEIVCFLWQDGDYRQRI